MRAKMLVVSLGTLLAIVGLWFVLTTRTARREAVSEIDRLRQRGSQLVAETERTSQRLTVLENERARVKVALAAARRKPAKSAPGPVRSPAPVPPELAAMRDGWANDARYQNRLLAETRTRYVETYRLLVRDLNLTAAQAAQLVENLLKRYEWRMDFVQALEKLPPAPGDAGVLKTGQQQIDEAYRAAQVELLGPAGYEKLDFYERSLALRRFVDEFAGKTAVAGAPITGAQADALLESMAKASPFFKNGHSAQMERIDWTAVLVRTSAELSEPQFAMLKNAAVPYWNMDRLRDLVRPK